MKKQYKGVLILVCLLYGFALLTANPWYMGFAFASGLAALISILWVAIGWILD